MMSATSLSIGLQPTGVGEAGGGDLAAALTTTSFDALVSRIGVKSPPQAEMPKGDAADGEPIDAETVELPAMNTDAKQSALAQLAQLLGEVSPLAGKLVASVSAKDGIPSDDMAPDLPNAQNDSAAKASVVDQTVFTVPLAIAVVPSVAPGATTAPSTPSSSPSDTAEISLPGHSLPATIDRMPPNAATARTSVVAPGGDAKIASVATDPAFSPELESADVPPLVAPGQQAASQALTPGDIDALFPMAGEMPIRVRFGQAAADLAPGLNAPTTMPPHGRGEIAPFAIASAEAQPAIERAIKALLIDVGSVAPAMTTMTTASVATPPVAPSAVTSTGAPMAAPAEIAIQHHLDLAHDGAWLDRLARDIAATAGQDSRLRFQLNPEHLGALKVEIAHGGDGASIRLTADTDAARSLLVDAQPRLVAEARAQGVRIAETHVDLGGQQAGQGAGTGTGQRQNVPAQPVAVARQPFAQAEAEETSGPRDRYA